jgi:hypothetical protein
LSSYHVVQWSVNPTDFEPCEQAVKAVAEHAHSMHPVAKSFRTYRQSYGPLPVWAYIALFEYESLAALDNDPDTPSCEEVWAPIYALAQPGSLAVSIWADSQRESWFKR